jgi:hypothetical protein
MTKDLQKQIEELEKIANPNLANMSASKQEVAFGIIPTARDALKIINQLQEEADKYKLLWESTYEDAKAIIAELEHENQEYIKTFRLITAEDGCSRMSKRAFEVLKQFGKL